MKYGLICLMTICLSLDASAGVFKNLAKNAGVIKEEPPVVENIEYIGMPDKEWIATNDLPETALEVLELVKCFWLVHMDEQCALSSEELTSNKIEILKDGSVLYYAVLPESIIKYCFGYIHYGEVILYLTSDGFYICTDHSEDTTYFIYYTAVLEEEVVSKGKWFHPDNWPRSDNSENTESLFENTLPWDLEKLKETIKKEEETIKQREDARREHQARLAKLDAKINLGPFTLGMSRSELPKGEFTDDRIGFGTTFIPADKITFASQPVDKSYLKFDHDVLVKIALVFEKGQDNTILINALNKKYYITSWEKGWEIVSGDYLEGWACSYEWKSKSNRLVASTLPPGSESLMKSYSPMIVLETTRFAEKIKATKIATEKQKQIEDEKKAEAMMDDL